ncbi:MAG: NADH-quinone oxidoreductase subunit L [Fimbriimonadales bacterium]|nr:NADH-quinone oxidoreductase subunit L [Fimbriimonadales bacterium]
MDPFALIWWIVLLPLAGSLVQALFGGAVVRALGPRSGKRLMGALAVLPVAVGFLLGLALLTAHLEAGAATERVVTLAPWIDLAGLKVDFAARVDSLSLLMVLVVTGVGALIHLYATGYMADDRDYTRFFTYMNLFVAFMLVLVTADNLPLLFVGWEGVGLCSYLLIGFWYKDVANAKAANKAFIVNRIGDWGFMLGMFLILACIAGTVSENQTDNRWLDFGYILPKAYTYLADRPELATAIALLLFVGACGKSAQFPLYIWLPDAMAGPTPVSALIHAATMVTAGVYLVSRMHVFYVLSPVASAVVAAVGAFTALFAALVAFGQTDIKKVLAYSTVSQLGFMFVACGAGVYWAGMFHVATHAFFKALLFLGSGAVIYAMAHNQDLRNYGNLRKYLPITCWTMFVGYLAIAGVPPLAGFFSKEAILGGALGSRHAAASLAVWAGWVGLLTAALTAAYMTRLTMLTFFGREERWRRLQPAHGHGHGHASDHGQHYGFGHGNAGAHSHQDPHGFFLTDEEAAALARQEDDGHHHDLDPSHRPKEAPPSMTLPLVALALLSVVGGWGLQHWAKLETFLQYPGLRMLPQGAIQAHPHGIPLLALSIGAAALGIAYGWVVYRRGLPKGEGFDEERWHPFRRWAGRQFGYDDALVQTGVQGGDVLANTLWKGFDAGVIDGIANGLGALACQLGRGLKVIQTGFVRSYALLMLAGGVALLAYMVAVLMRIGGGN